MDPTMSDNSDHQRHAAWPSSSTSSAPPYYPHVPRLSLAAGSWVLVHNPEGGLPIIGQIDSAYQSPPHEGAQWQLSITRFLRAEETWHGPSRSFWPNEIFKTNLTSTHSIREVLAPCFAMSPAQFRIGTPKQPIWSPQTELFLVESKYSVHPAGPAHPSHSSRPFTKLSNWKNLVESCLNLRPDPLALEKQPSPFLASPSGRHAHNPIGGLLSADSDASQSLKRSFSEDTTASSSQCGSSPPDTKKSRKSFVDSHALASRPTPPYFSAHASPPPPAPASLPPPPPPSTEETTSAAEAHQRPSLPHSSSAQTLTPCTTQQQQRAATQRGCSSSSETTQHPFKSQGDEGEEEEVETICGVRRFNPWQNTRHEKPPFTYASLVAQAIHHAPEKRATLDQIYRFVVEQYPWYRSEDARSWHNSIRHNLSLRKCFVKTERDGKGAYWSLIFPNNSDESFDGVNFSTGKYRRTPSVSSHSGGGGGHRRTSGGSISSTTTGVSSLFDSISDVSSFSAASVATPPSSHHQFGGHQPVLDKEQILPPSLTAPLHHHHNNTNTNAEPFAPPPVPSRSRPQSSTRSPVTESTSSSAATTRTASPAAVAVDPVASAAAAFEVSDAAKAFMARYQGQPERPPFTFAALCAQAVTQSSSGAPSLAEIYEYIQDHYPFFQKNAKGWQNSVRHNLSLKACFIKITRPSTAFRRTTRQGTAVKGGCWTIGAADLAKFDGAQFAKESTSSSSGSHMDHSSSQRSANVSGASSSRSRATSVALSEDVADGRSEANTSAESTSRQSQSHEASPSALDLLSLACQQVD